MNFDPTNEQRRWRDLARDFASLSFGGLISVIARKRPEPGIPALEPVFVTWLLYRLRRPGRLQGV